MNRKTKYISTLIKRNVAEVDPNAEVILYGSRARGEEWRESDWDILVLTGYSVDMNKEREFRNHLYDLELETEEPFSVFIFSKKEWESKHRVTPFYHNVLNEGIYL